jgi:hypothetical protein
VARPTVHLLDLVRERRFNAKNQRHRAKLLEDDSLLDFVRESEFVAPLYTALAEIQTRYRQAYGVLDRSHTSGASRSFELSLKRLNENGEPR